jgi:predicted RNA-binding protein with TRAM domain
MTSNEDRYGYRHRQDPAHDVGDSAPGTVGDSEGTFHDRARKGTNVIIDGEVTTQEEYERSSEQQNSDQPSKQTESSTSSQSNSLSELDGNKVTVTVDRISGSGNAIAEYNGYHVHVEDGSPGEEYRVQLQAESTYLTGQQLETNS